MLDDRAIKALLLHTAARDDGSADLRKTLEVDLPALNQDLTRAGFPQISDQ